MAVPPQPHDAWVEPDPWADDDGTRDPGGTERAPRYRSLKDLSSGQARDIPLTRSATDQAPAREPSAPGDAGWRTRPASASFGPPRGDVPSRRRIWLGVVAAVSLVVVAALVWGGLQFYQFMNPNFGRNYLTGGTATVAGVEFTVSDLECGRDSAPDMAGAPDEGQFCVVRLAAENVSESQRYISLDLITAYLDSARQVTPDVNAMLTLFGALEAQASAEYVVVYDIADDARMEELTILLGTEFGTIDLSD